MTGVAAILRFPLPGLDDIDEEEVDSDDELRAEMEDEEEKEEEKKSFEEEQLEFLLNNGLVQNVGEYGEEDDLQVSETNFEQIEDEDLEY
jgi:hypothetical protein